MTRETFTVGPLETTPHYRTDSLVTGMAARLVSLALVHLRRLDDPATAAQRNNVLCSLLAPAFWADSVDDVAVRRDFSFRWEAVSHALFTLDMFTSMGMLNQRASWGGDGLYTLAVRLRGHRYVLGFFQSEAALNTAMQRLEEHLGNLLESGQGSFENHHPTPM